MPKLKSNLFSETSAVISISIGILVILVSIVVFFCLGSFSFDYRQSINEEKIAQFGDFIGGFVGSIFSLVGILLFYVALTEQRKDFATSQETLKIQLSAFQQQVKEFEAQRDELVETRRIYEQQNKTMKIQQFDSNFYSLLNVFIEQRANLDPNGAGEFFSMLYDKILDGFEVDGRDFSVLFKEACKKYIQIYHTYRPKLALYFMTLYRLFKTIEDSENLNEAERTSYHKVVRSLITKEELILLYYNYQSSFGKKPLPIVMKYNYLKHLERFDKLEFKNFSFSADNIVKANLVSDMVYSLITTNLHQASNLDQTSEVREEVIVSEGVIVGIYIEELVEVKVIVESIVTSILNLSVADFVKFLECITIDVLYHSEFKKFSSDLLDFSLLTTGTKEEHIFKFKLS